MNIPKEWWETQVTVEEVEALTQLDRVKKVVPFEFADADVIDKNMWFKDPLYKDTPMWNKFKEQLQEGDQLWYYRQPGISGHIVQTAGPVHGYLIARDGKVIYTLVGR